MIFIFRNIICIIIIGCFFCCTSVKQKTAKQDQQDSVENSKRKLTLNLQDKIPAGKCRIVGSIVEIDRQFRTSNADDPCSNAPCLAIVQIDSIVGYGSGFAATFYKGQKISIIFKFSLLPSKQAIPDLKETLPGLKEGSSFIADVDANPVLGQGNKRQYSIYKYQIN